MTQDATPDAFGELRSLAHGAPSAQAWERLSALCLDIARADEDRWRAELLPYVDAALNRWPAHLRVMSPLDARALLHGMAPSPVMPLARLLAPRTPARAALASWEQLAQHPALAHIQHLVLEGCGLDAPHLAALLSSPHLGAVRHLALRHCSFGLAGVELLAQHPLTARLESLSLADCHVGWRGGRALERLELPSVQTLRIVGCKIGRRGVHALGHGPNAPSPYALTLDAYDLRASDATDALCGPSPLLSRVRRLEFLHMYWLSPTFELSRVLDRCDTLEHIDLPLEGISRERRATLFAHPRLRSLRSLYTEFIFRPDLRDLARLLDAPFIHNLRALDLSGSDLKDDGARMIAGCAALAGLTSLDLRRCRIKRAGFDALIASPHLCAAVRASLDPVQLDDAYYTPTSAP